ncbi:MAG: hypothetical protein K2G90_00745 [Muribaculaceae bacterium]|nr:hypothetical protein [Muribaculaceae bacterium]
MTMTTEDVAKVLMKRDEISHDEAMDLITECAQAIRDSGYDIIEADSIMSEYLGLEPDYMFAVLDILPE